MSKHTPGPWKHFSRCEVRDGHEKLVANTLLDDDARLIAAAPGMLEALKGLGFYGCFCEVRIGNPMMTNHSAACIAALAAIAKAEGK